MPFLELSLRCSEAEQPRYERALEGAGALAVTLLDADADTSSEAAILEPGVGETPLWRAVVLSALFPHDADGLSLLSALESFDAGLDWSRVEFRHVEDQDWERAWMDTYEPLRFGRRTWIVPWDHDLPEEARADDAAVVRLDPGLAFGSGTHPTTALCLQWLDALADAGELQGRAVLDYGCGSGILALAALRLGACAAVGVDNDPQALEASRDNAERNGLSDALVLRRPKDMPSTAPGETAADACPVVVANILASALDGLAEVLAGRTLPGGRIALSGILDGQEEALLRRYRPWFEGLAVAREGDWVRIDGVRRRD